ncbi:thiamine biosynthesis protein ThiI [Paenibacillus sp. SORGH_AS306]|uniref:tRNA uracil 4-sulfurtransferase ThiI n=1 Tax=unclassified Paenibacillus TaxID=185978 RepID=UPI00278528E4|nr:MULTISPECIES: tRNA uracil 4-sulfurtransferase ThiI [unclassified Paenibacillus]MDQ1235029.1 thiamine biosynthesis protein ThiI [Paenibacillus sp. SORGH_AS_0306]MDR6112077.1 thiamine biosynthesis protein ThiI [Paenibacillus sp. SORGH_AS_0338]
MQNIDRLILRLGEITLKGKNRSRFEKTISEHVRAVLRPYPKAHVRREYGRMYVETGGESVEALIQVLKNVFGIMDIIPVKQTLPQLDDIIAAAIELIGEQHIDQLTTFKVSVKRVWKEFPHSSQEMNHLVGSPVLRAYPLLKVDVRQPQIELRVEIRDGAAYIYSELIPAVGGFPRGSNGKAMLLLSGGIDSPVAGWQSMRRGLEVECIHFHSYPFTSERAKEKVVDLTRVLAGYAGVVKLHVVPFTEIQTAFTTTGQDNLMITLMRRAMLRIATKIAEQQKGLALITGESLGQVASQTLSSMNAIERATELPILRPLVMTGKDEIIQIAKEIGTYDLSILPYEDCCTLFIPKSPTTNPNLRIIEKVESFLKLEPMIERAVEQTEVLTIEAGSPLQLASTAINEDWF